MGCVYMARNIANGKCYVGKTVVTMEHRRAWHHGAANRGEGFCFHRALRKYGFDGFAWEVLHESDDSDELIRIECECIAKLGTKRPRGYNLTDGGDGVVGVTPEGAARIVAFHTGRKRSKDTRKRISVAMAGKQNRLGAVLTEETKRKISLASSKYRHTDESKSKLSAAMKGKPKTPEQRRKMSESGKRQWVKRKEVAAARKLLEDRDGGQVMLWDLIGDGAVGEAEVDLCSQTTAES